MKTGEIVIKNLTNENIEESCELLLNTFPDITKKDKNNLASSIETSRSNLYCKYFVLSEKLSNKVIGITGIYEELKDSNDSCWLGWFCIDKEYQGQGYSKKLLDFSIDKALSLGKKQMKIYTYDSSESKKAIGLYKSYGFDVFNKENSYLFFNKSL